MTKLSIASLSLAVGISACSDARATDVAAQEDLKRDLQLAASATMDLVSPRVDPSLLTLESKPQTATEQAKTVRKGAGTRAVRSPNPTVRATPEVDVAALDESAQVESLSEARAEEAISEPVAVAPRPVQVIVPAAGGDYGAGSGGGVFGGGMGGVVIRGGGVDGDNCELHRGGRRTRGPIYIPNNPYPQTVGVGGGVIRIGSSFPGSGSVRRSIPQSTARSQTISRPTYGRPRGR